MGKFLYAGLYFVEVKVNLIWVKEFKLFTFRLDTVGASPFEALLVGERFFRDAPPFFFC